jgi:hypothetical protein
VGRETSCVYRVHRDHGHVTQAAAAADLEKYGTHEQLAWVIIIFSAPRTLETFFCEPEATVERDAFNAHFS